VRRSLHGCAKKEWCDGPGREAAPSGVLRDRGSAPADALSCASNMCRVNVPPLTWLYVPGDRPDRVEKALASEAHAVIVDLEDGVEPAAKAEARANLRALLGHRRDKPVFVRVNAGDADDLEVVSTLAIDGVCVPKVARAEDIPSLGLPVHCLLESAAGVEAAYEIAKTRGVAGISLGEADLRSETGALETGLDWARARIVNAAVAAGLPRPPQSVYARLNDDEGLARSCLRGRELGHLGRSAIHPAQLRIIEQAYLPTAEEVAHARATVERLEHSLGAATLAGGEFVDAAMLGAARQILAIAARFGTAAAQPVPVDD
jgi:citrate lyase subunit beta/citryl-CoA lyase